jgi:hypothetical protein
MNIMKRIILGIALTLLTLSVYAGGPQRDTARYLPNGRYMLTLAIEGQNLSSFDGKVTWHPNGESLQFESAKPSAISVTFSVVPWDNSSGDLSGLELTGTALGRNADSSYLLTGRYFFPPDGKPTIPASSTQGLGACKVAGFSPGRGKAREVVSGRWSLTAIK